MMRLKIYRPIFIDSFKKNSIGSFSSKSNRDDPPLSSSKVVDEDDSNKTRNDVRTETDRNRPHIEDVTDKINSILRAMIKDNAEARERKESAKKKMPVEDYKFHSRKIDIPNSDAQNPDQEIRNAAAFIAQSLGNDKQIEEQLVTKALEHKDPQKINMNWSELIQGMQIDNSKSTEDYINMSSRAHQVKQVFIQKKIKPFGEFKTKRTSTTPFSPKLESIDLFGGPPLGIFEKDSAQIPGTHLQTWSTLEEYEKKIAVTQPPANYYQKMIMWTKEGKIWKFPIDNEQDLDEKFVPFSEHVFLEVHLDGWCPEKGPIRHFMELVCVGMSKNPYMPVKDKVETIAWFKNYFDSKRELLEQIGVYGNSVEKSAPKIA